MSKRSGKLTRTLAAGLMTMMMMTGTVRAETRQFFIANTFTGLDSPRALTFDGTYIWFAGPMEDGEPGYDANKGEMYAMDMAGLVRSGPYPLPDTWPGDLGFDGQYLWITNLKTDNLTIYQYDQMTGMKVAGMSFPTPEKRFAGLTFDGESLWAADYLNDSLCQYDMSGNPLKTITKTDLIAGDPNKNNTHDNPRGLAFARGHLWLADSTDDKIYRLNIEGDVVVMEEYATPSPNANPVPTGLAFDGTYLWLSDWSSNSPTGTVYRLAIPVGKGDVNGDGFVNLTDGVLSLQLASGISVDDVTVAADVDGDKALGMAEVVFAMRTAAGLE